MEKLRDIEKERELKGVSWDELAKGLPVSGNALRIAFSRNSVKESYLDEVLKVLASNELEEPEIVYKTKSGKEISLDEIALLASRDMDNFFSHRFFSNEIEKRVAKRLLVLSSSPDKLKEFLNS